MKVSSQAKKLSNYFRLLQADVVYESLVLEEMAHVISNVIMQDCPWKNSPVLFGKSGASVLFSSKLDLKAINYASGVVARYLSTFALNGVSPSIHAAMLLHSPEALYVACSDTCPDDLKNLNYKAAMTKQSPLGMADVMTVLGASVGLYLGLEPVGLNDVCANVSAKLGADHSGLVKFSNDEILKNQTTILANMAVGIKAAEADDASESCSILQQVKPVDVGEFVYSVKKLSSDEAEKFLALTSEQQDVIFEMIHQD